MLNKDLLLQLTIVLAILMLGFILRAETINLHGISIDEKSFYQDDHGLPYFYELDSYYNYRLTHNFLDHGYLGDEIIDGREWDLHSYYPPGVPLDYPPLIVYLTAFLYRVVNFFSNVPLHMISFWLPSFIAPLAGVIAYFFTRRFTNELGALAAGILTVMAPFYLLELFLVGLTLICLT